MCVIVVQGLPARAVRLPFRAFCMVIYLLHYNRQMRRPNYNRLLTLLFNYQTTYTQSKDFELYFLSPQLISALRVMIFSQCQELDLGDLYEAGI